MKKSIVYTVLVVNMFSASCKKNSTDPSKSTDQEMLLGKWVIISEASDENNNGSMDSPEIRNRNKDLSYLFEDNGNATETYKVNGGTGNSHYTWVLSGKDLTLTDKSSKNKFPYYIETISKSELKLKYKEPGSNSNRYHWRTLSRD